LPVSSRAHIADYARRTLLLLVAVVLGYARLEQLSRLVVFGENDNLRFLCLWSHKSAEHSAISQAAIASRHGGLHLARGIERRTLTTRPLQKPVPLSNQSLFFSS
jgi:hypothetical protein